MAGAPKGSREERRRFWAAHVEEWKQSSVSKRRYCELQSLPLHTFSKWSKNLLGSERAPMPDIELIHLGPLRPTAIAPIAVVLGGGRYRVELSEGFNAAALREVIGALEVR